MPRPVSRTSTLNIHAHGDARLSAEPRRRVLQTHQQQIRQQRSAGVVFQPRRSGIRRLHQAQPPESPPAFPCASSRPALPRLRRTPPRHSPAPARTVQLQHCARTRSSMRAQSAVAVSRPRAYSRAVRGRDASRLQRLDFDDRHGRLQLVRRVIHRIPAASRDASSSLRVADPVPWPAPPAPGFDARFAAHRTAAASASISSCRCGLTPRRGAQAPPQQQRQHAGGQQQKQQARRHQKLCRPLHGFIHRLQRRRIKDRYRPRNPRLLSFASICRTPCNASPRYVTPCTRKLCGHLDHPYRVRYCGVPRVRLRHKSARHRRAPSTNPATQIQRLRIDGHIVIGVFRVHLAQQRIRSSPTTNPASACARANKYSSVAPLNPSTSPHSSSRTAAIRRRRREVAAHPAPPPIPVINR